MVDYLLFFLSFLRWDFPIAVVGNDDCHSHDVDDDMALLGFI